MSALPLARSTHGIGLVFINHSEETFTPTASGALATHIWECARRAQAAGDRPIVITRAAVAESFALEDLRELPYPWIPTGEVGTLAMRARRKFTGVPRLGLGRWARRVADVVRAVSGEQATLVLQNDVELACLLREHLPDARLLLLFQNQLPAREPYRTRLRDRVDSFAAVSAFTAAWVADHYGLDSEAVTVIASGVDSAVFRPADATSSPATVGFVGRTGLEKAPDTLLEAALRISETTTNFRVQIVGSNHWGAYTEDDYQRRLSALSSTLAARGVDVVRPGHVSRPDLPSWLRRSDIHVVPSRWEEPFGLTTLEGMASGNALLASRTGGTPEVVGDAGQLFDADDVDGLATLLLDLVRDDAARAAWGERARHRAEQFTWEKTYAAIRTWAARPGA